MEQLTYEQRLARTANKLFYLTDIFNRDYKRIRDSYETITEIYFDSNTKSLNCHIIE